MPGGGAPPVQRTRVSNARLALLFGVGVAMIGLVPVAHLMLSPSSRVDGSKELAAQTSMRGAYINSGSRDAGPDRPL